MAAEKKKVYGNMRIMAIEGKDIFRTDALTALKNGKLNALQQPPMVVLMKLGSRA